MNIEKRKITVEMRKDYFDSYKKDYNLTDEKLEKLANEFFQRIVEAHPNQGNYWEEFLDYTIFPETD